LAQAGVVLGGLAAVCAVLAWLEPLCLGGAVWGVGGVLPVSQGVAVPDPVAERFCYLPMVGVGIFAAGVVAGAGEGAPRGGASARRGRSRSVRSCWCRWRC